MVWLLSCVNDLVLLERALPSETPSTLRALIGLLPRVSALVGFEVALVRESVPTLKTVIDFLRLSKRGVISDRIRDLLDTGASCQYQILTLDLS